jgi:hypothetical protein
MKKLTLALALIFPTIEAMATTKPVYEIAQTEAKAQSKLYDAELTEVHTKRDGMCFKFDALSIFDKDKVNPLHGRICGDKITLE